VHDLYRRLGDDPVALPRREAASEQDQARMVKEKRTNKELETTILGCCIARDLDVERVIVWPSGRDGWDATYTAAPALMVLYRTRFERIVTDLQKDFDLDWSG
jgi:hypothetical protein